MKAVKWSIWIVNLDPTVGSEQGKTRPVIVISDNIVNDALPVINVLPITSRKSGRKIYPNEALISGVKTGLEKESIVLCYQIRTIDKERLIREVGKLTEKELQNQIIQALSFQLGFKF